MMHMQSTEQNREEQSEYIPKRQQRQRRQQQRQQQRRRRIKSKFNLNAHYLHEMQITKDTEKT